MKQIISRKAFYELEVWKKARKLRNDAFQLVIHFPLEEKYGLTDQIKKGFPINRGMYRRSSWEIYA